MTGFGPLLSEATTLPTEPQLLSQIFLNVTSVVLVVLHWLTNLT